MSIPEACRLVLQAASIGTGGEIFVLDMGAPVKILDLAKQMIRLAGLKVGKDIEIEFTGLRPGEKLFEELFIDNEHTLPTEHPLVKMARPDNSKIDFVSSLDDLTKNIENASDAFIKIKLKALIPQYTPFGLNIEEHTLPKPQDHVH